MEIIIWGGTLWSHCTNDILLNLPIYNESLQPITKQEYNQQFINHLQHLQQTIQEAKQNKKKLIVCTHYAPSFECMDDKWKTSPRNCLYATNLHSLLNDPTVCIWISGHTHVNMNRKIGETICISNCDPSKSDYNPQFVIQCF